MENPNEPNSPANPHGSTESRHEFFELVDRLTEAVHRASTTALRALEQAQVHQEIITTQAQQIELLGAVVAQHQAFIEALAKPAGCLEPQVH